MRWLVLLLLLIPAASALPQPTGFVNDHAGMFSGQEAALERLLQEIERNTTVEIAVLTITSLEGEPLEQYANDVFRDWGVGKVDVNNGVLILIVEDSRDIRIEVGTGLEGVLTDATAGIIIRNRMTPMFRQGQYAEGVALAAADIAALAAGDPTTVSAYEMAQRPSNDWKYVIVLLAIYSAIMVYARVKYKEDKKRKDKIMRKVSSLTFVVAWIMTMFISSAILWFVLFFILMINITTSGYSGMMFFPGPGGRGGSGGFGGFGGGFSGGGGASGGW